MNSQGRLDFFLLNFGYKKLSIQIGIRLTLLVEKQLNYLMDTLQGKLSLYTYASTFLMDYYNDQKMNLKNWSFEYWSRKLNIKKTTLVKTVRGDIPMGNKIETVFCKYFKFTESEKKYFKLIAINEKISKLYPDLPISLPEMEAVKKQHFKLSVKSDLKTEDMALLSRPEVQWLLTLFSGQGFLIKDLEKIDAFFHPGIKGINWKALIKLCLEKKILKQIDKRIVFKFDDKLYLDGKMTGIEVAVHRYSQILNYLQQMILSDYQAGKVPAVNNLGFCVRVDKNAVSKITSQVDRALKEIYAAHASENGAHLVDVQFFISPIKSL